jgi:spore maturation protein SpmB
MRKRLTVAVIASGLALGVAASTYAHHSLTVFDYKVETTINGTVTSFLYQNPHCFLYVDVKGPDGTVTNWAIEASAIPAMVRRGIQRSTFKPGDVVSVTINPLKSGVPGGKYVSAVAADGKTYKE